MWEFSSLIRLWDRQLVLKQRRIIEEVMLMIRNKFRKHNDDYNELIERDFCDALITSRNVSLRDGKQWASYLTDENLAMIVYDLFFAGNDTTQRTFQWLLLLIAYYPDVQKRLKDEIESHIGDRRARHEDRQQCPYTMAMMAETLRYRNVARFGVTHKAMVDTKIGEIFVRKGTDVGVYQGIILDSSDYWDKPDMFRPERFLDSDGNYMTNRPQAYIPFGLGRRVCLGERLAIADLFLVLVRFLQLTKDYDIILNSHNGLDPDPNVAESYLPKEYTICFKNKN
ncbi:steroid 17-alpha-hydroxylase/17,20 lyase-like [Oppia nitens]|uniref:steroid 17-alpha-hydroxylase/17,20 lyase-like n=1 Tax=Oppia nitens TaxID=1686743 RepID=UPI0023DBC108|nr:steroid 17-alpha-hydroxylase/17,20 lyase-like [Oppia nitens]